MIDKKQLEKYLQGRLSKPELEAFRQYLQQEEVTALEQLMHEQWENNPALQEKIEETLSQEMLQNIKQAIVIETPVRRLVPRRSWQVAAAVLLIIATAVIWWQLSGISQKPTLVINDSNTVKKVELQDGSTIWLNQQTRLTYLITRRKRNLTLKGEAFFEVTKDPRRPFSVQTGNMSTTVLGTSFNIEAFPEDERVEVSLVTGKVAVKIEKDGASKNWEMKPGEQLQYLPVANEVMRSTFLTKDETAWREGQLVLQKMPLTTALRQISRFYNTELQFDTLQLKKCMVTSTFDKNNSIDDVLEVLLFSNDLTYQKKGATYTIEGPGCK